MSEELAELSLSRLTMVSEREKVYDFAVVQATSSVILESSCEEWSGLT